MIKWRFTAILQPDIMKKASDFLTSCDLDQGEIGYEQVFTFSSVKDIEVSQVKQHLIQACEECDIKVLKIEGGRIE